MTQEHEDEVTPEAIEMLMVFDRLRGELAARLHPAWDIAPDGMKFRAMPGDGPQDLNELAIWFHEAHPELSEAIDALEQQCVDAAMEKAKEGTA